MLDAPRLTELRDNLAPGLLAGLVDQCLQDLTVRMTALKAAIAEGRHERIEAQAHAMAGMAASYAMAAMEVRLRRMIQAARRADTAGARAAAEGLDEDLSRTDAALRAIFGTVPR